MTSLFSFSNNVFKRYLCKQPLENIVGKGENDGDSFSNNVFKRYLCEQPLENFVGKGENAGDQHLLLFQQCFQEVSL